MAMPPSQPAAHEIAPLRFDPPGPGAWELDAEHFARPLAPVLCEVFAEAFPEGMRRTMAAHGMPLETIACEVVNGFPYMQPRPIGAPAGGKPPPRWLMRILLPIMIRLHPEMRRRAATAKGLFERRPWRQAVADWDDRLRDATIAAHQELGSVDLGRLDDRALADHFEAIRAHGVRVLTQDHSLNGTAMLPLGDFLVQVGAWTGLDEAEIMHALRGSSAISAGDSRERRRLVAALRDQPEALALVGDPTNDASEVLERLTRWPGELGEATRQYRLIAGNVITMGIGIDHPTADEEPGQLLAALRIVIATRRDAHDETCGDEAIARLRAKIPAEHGEQFDQLLDDARSTYRLRDERHIYGALPLLGMVRKALLEAGRRLVARGVVDTPEQLFMCGAKEVVGMLRGESVTVDWAQRRVVNRLDATKAPHTLGPSGGEPPDPAWLPVDMGRAMRAIDAYLGSVSGKETREQTGTELRGMAVSAGTYEGIARVCHDVGDLDKIQPGDVLVAPLTTPAINVVLPILGAIVTDRGGALSHAAIVSREFGIPGVVGTSVATREIADGARVLVDGDTGTVRVLR